MPIDFTNIKLTGNRPYDTDMAKRLNDSLYYLPIKKRAVVLADMMEESGLDPLAKSKGNNFQGLLQWGEDRYRISSNDREKELSKQLQEFKNTVNNISDKKSWTDGGKGSGYQSNIDAYRDFYNYDSSLEDAHRGFSFGYVRPSGKEVSHKNRLKVAQQIYDRYLQDIEERTTGMGPHAAQYELFTSPPEVKIDNYYRKEGGQIDRKKTWNDLSMKEKSEMMKIAVQYGISDLNLIKDTYNEYAEGGPTEKDKWTMLDEAGYREWRNNLPDNLKNTDDSDYDMRGAYKAGMQPTLEDDGYYHLGSRDPRTGRILKSPWHPTYPVAIWSDAAMGYYPTYRNGQTYTEQLPWVNRYAEGGPENQPYTPFLNETPMQAAMKQIQSPEARAAYWNATHPQTTSETPMVAQPNGTFRRETRNIPLQDAQLNSDVLSFTPGIGDAMFAKDVYDAAKEGDYGTAAAMAGMALIPNVVEKPLKAIGINKGLMAKIFKDYDPYRYNKPLLNTPKVNLEFDQSLYGNIDFKNLDIVDDKFTSFLKERTGKDIKRKHIKEYDPDTPYDEGFVFLDENNRRIASIAGPKHGKNVWVEFSYVDPEFRSKGLGKQMYIDFNDYVFGTNGTTLRSYPHQHMFTLEDSEGRRISPSSNLWRGLRKDGYATLENKGPFTSDYIMAEPAKMMEIRKYLSGGPLVQLANKYEEGGDTNSSNIVDWIIGEEGFSSKPENIGDGKITLGSGLTNSKWHKIYNKKGTWTAEDNRAAVAEEVENRRRWAEQNIPNWSELPADSQNALLSYKYNYNFTRNNSPKLFKALEDRNYEEAARQMDATSRNPIFRKGLQARRQREQEMFMRGINSMNAPEPEIVEEIPQEESIYIPPQRVLDNIAANNGRYMIMGNPPLAGTRNTVLDALRRLKALNLFVEGGPLIDLANQQL